MDAPELRLMRWTVPQEDLDGPNRPQWKDRVFSPVRKWRGGEWRLCYYCATHCGKDCGDRLILQLVSDAPPDPFDVSAQLELDGTERIATEHARRETRCTHENGRNEYGAVHRWLIWWRSDSDIERSDPDGHLRFLVVIRDAGHATPTGHKLTITLSEDIEEFRPSASISGTQTECRIPKYAGQSPATASTSPLFLNTPACLESLSEDLCKYLVQGSDTDIEFQCEGVSIGAHAAVICARSPVLASMMASDVAKGTPRVVKVPSIELHIFKHFLRYLYTGTLPELTVELALKLYESGYQGAVLGLTRRCSKYLLEHLSIHNAYDILLFAEAHGDGGLTEKVVEYMVETKVPLVSDRWSAFCDAHPTLANRVSNRS